MTLDITWFFMKFLKMALLYKKHDTFRYGTFLYIKSQTFRKKQDNLCYVFIYEYLDTLRYAIFHWIFDIDGRGVRHFYMQKAVHFALHIYMQKKRHFVFRFYIKKS